MKEKRKYACGGTSFAHAMFVQNATNEQFMEKELHAIKELAAKKNVMVQVKRFFGKVSIFVNENKIMSFDKNFVEECRIQSVYMFRTIVTEAVEKACEKSVS